MTEFYKVKHTDGRETLVSREWAERWPSDYPTATKFFANNEDTSGSDRVIDTDNP